MTSEITLGCGRVVTLGDLDTAKISYVPCNEEQPLLKFASFLSKRVHVGKAAYGKKWNAYTTRDMTGVQLMCGKPTYRRTGRTGYLYYTSLDLEKRLLTEYPDIAEQIQTIYRDNCEGTPCEIQTKSDGLRLDAYTAYCGKKWAFKDDGGMLLEVLADKCLARIDHRYTMLSGSLLEMPTLPKEALQEIHGIISAVATTETTGDDKPREVVETSQIGDLDIEWGSDGRSQLFPTQYCQQTDHRSNRYEVRFTKHSDGSVDGKCFNCGETWWEIPPRDQSRAKKINAVRDGQLSPLALYRKPVKLVKIAGNALLDTLVKTQELIAKILRIDARIIGFRADTGTGKNYETENYALSGDAILVNVPTGDLAIDLEIRMIDRLSKRGMPRENVFRRRGLMHHWNKGKDAHLRFPYDIPCIQAARCDAFRRKGGNMFKTICPECPVKHLCVEHGYLSQPERAKQALMVIMSHPDFHINPALRGFAKQYLTDTYGEQRLVVQDDVSTHAVFNISEITRERLQQMRDEWDGAFLGSFAKELLRLLEAEGTPYAIGEYLDSLTTKQKGLLNYQLTRVRMETTDADGTPHHFTMTLDEAVANGFFPAETEADIAEMPAVDKNGWTLLDQLTAFFAHYTREADAPIAYHKGTLTFAIPPRLHPKVWKAVFMSATLDLDLFKRPFPKAHIENLPPTAWHTDAKLYPLRTNRNPRATVYKFKMRKKKKKRKAVSLSATGEHYWRMMVDEIARTPDIKHGIITYKKVLKWKRNEEASDLSELDNIVATAHYGNLVGLDTNFQDVETLWILFAPEIPHHEIVWRAKMFFGDDEKPLNDGRDENGVYLDERLQQIWENAVLAELIQAIGRSRLVRNAKKVILLTSHFIPGITDRIETRLFDEADWEIADGLDGLDEAIAKREAFEARAAELTGENTIEDYQEVYGCSYERARQLWHEAGGQEAKDEMEAETAAQARDLRDQGLSLRKIADKLGTYAERIRRLLDET